MDRARRNVALRGIAALLAVSLFGCIEPSGYRCSSTENCAGDGRCEATGYCSFVDPGCPSGRRYGGYASSALAAQCTPMANASLGPNASDASQTNVQALDAAADAAPHDGPIDAPPAPIDAAAPDAAPQPPTPDAAIDAPMPDASVDAPSSDAAVGCTGRSPLIVVDRSYGTGYTCSPSNARVTDGVSAGLDYHSVSGQLAVGTVATVAVTGCILADFGAAANLDPVTVRTARADSACGTACGGSFCESAVSLCVFRSATGIATTDFSLVACSAVGQTLSDITLHLGASTRYLLLCRDGSGPARSDILIDSVKACR